jgi:hypothetical protein
MLLLFCPRNEASLFIEQFAEILPSSEWQFCEFVAVFSGFYYAPICHVEARRNAVCFEQFVEILPSSEWQFCELVAVFQAFIMFLFCHSEALEETLLFSNLFGILRQNDKFVSS